MDPNDVMVPADVPDELIETYIENYLNATAGTGFMNLFACDQKIEHLNDDFYDGGADIPLSSNDPAHLFEIGDLSYADGTLGVIAGQLGLISQYARDAPDLPYLVKLNSKTNLVKTAQRDPVSMAMWDMDDVMSLVHNGINVVGIGYTVYLGSEHEHEMLTEAATFIRQAHELGMIAVVWMYPRGQAVKDEKDPQLIAGAAGVAACIGADFAKVNYPRAFEGMTQPESLGIAVEAAGRTGIICSGGGTMPPKEFLQRLHDQIHVSGCRGAATGRNIHQKGTEEAVRMAAACHAIICEDASVEDALAVYQG
ncbi:MAG TPA: aldolase [Candidatus Poseidoniaceae archaeon]|nr:MAG: aldolase [Euryarchaeota archaeon TMED141]DAC11391.1 MAG TPA: aldolase [Candidatus Poseidoniales archaeon]DAC15834.1 MAG TPA: aldolase [Candidatus Poseidoniales archaeon]HII17890.1 aldolase [Candidatus Poseidoniaceae archaeon]HII97397.1 aldolase [Candidatus Poseidoniaceae archaeon]|tara:strand:+ start:448 stop:1377 length:930 start_codon:yes stop_codon:yes gene_type:complete